MRDATSSRAAGWGVSQAAVPVAAVAGKLQPQAEAEPCRVLVLAQDHMTLETVLTEPYSAGRKPSPSGQPRGQISGAGLPLLIHALSGLSTWFCCSLLSILQELSSDLHRTQAQ